MRPRGIVGGVALTALLLLVRPWASGWWAGAELQMSVHLLGSTLVLVLIGFTLARAMTSQRGSAYTLAIPAIALLIVNLPFFLSDLFDSRSGIPYWLPRWWESMLFSFDTPVLIGVLLGASTALWRSKDGARELDEFPHPVDV